MMIIMITDIATIKNKFKYTLFWWYFKEIIPGYHPQSRIKHENRKWNNYTILTALKSKIHKSEKLEEKYEPSGMGKSLR